MKKMFALVTAMILVMMVFTANAGSAFVFKDLLPNDDEIFGSEENCWLKVAFRVHVTEDSELTAYYEEGWYYAVILIGKEDSDSELEPTVYYAELNNFGEIMWEQSDVYEDFAAFIDYNSTTRTIWNLRDELEKNVGNNENTVYIW